MTVRYECVAVKAHVEIAGAVRSANYAAPVPDMDLHANFGEGDSSVGAYAVEAFDIPSEQVGYPELMQELNALDAFDKSWESIGIYVVEVIHVCIVFCLCRCRSEPGTWLVISGDFNQVCIHSDLLRVFIEYYVR